MSKFIVTREAIVRLARNKSAKGKAEEVRAVLKKYGVASAREVHEVDYDDVYKALEVI